MSKKKAETTDAGTSVSVRLSKELLEWLDQRAEQENRSRANLIETLLKRAKGEQNETP
jgi:predicted transcriptional regulator